jgi:hypothetical protein
MAVGFPGFPDFSGILNVLKSIAQAISGMGVTLNAIAKELAPPTSTTVALTTVTSAYGISATTDCVIIASGSAFTVTLPTAVGITGKIFYIKNANTVASGFNITVATVGAQTIDGTTPPILSPLASLQVASNNVNWWII